jgi:hypothetical protein
MRRRRRRTGRRHLRHKDQQKTGGGTASGHLRVLSLVGRARLVDVVSTGFSEDVRAARLQRIPPRRRAHSSEAAARHVATSPHSEPGWIPGQQGSEQLWVGSSAQHWLSVDRAAVFAS